MTGMAFTLAKWLVAGFGFGMAFAVGVVGLVWIVAFVEDYGSRPGKKRGQTYGGSNCEA